MADSSEKKIWLDKSGKVLVNKTGNPFLTEGCCCGSDTGSCCWQYYEAICVDSDGNPVYGEDGTGKTSENSWTEGSMVSWECNSCTVSGRTAGAWKLDSPGTAYMWLQRPDLDTADSASSGCNSSYCSVATEVPGPGFPCSCSSIAFSAQSGVLPYMTIGFPVVRTQVWSMTVSGAVEISCSYTPGWDFSAAYVEAYDELLPAEPWTTYEAVYREAPIYHGNYQPASLPRPQCYMPKVQQDEGGNTIPNSAYVAWSSAKEKEDGVFWDELRGSKAGYNLKPIRLAGVDETTGEGIWANSVAFAYWNESTKTGRGPFSLTQYTDDNGELVFGPQCDAADELTGPSSVYRGYARTCCELAEGDRWEIKFKHNEWGHAEFTPLSQAYTTLYCVREARGAFTAVQDVPTALTKCVPAEPNSLAGSPEFYYRFFITTDCPVNEVNSSNWAYLNFADGGKGTADEAQVTWHVSAFGNSALFCPVYWNIYYTAEITPACSADPAQAYPFPGAGNLGAPDVGEDVYSCPGMSATDKWSMEGTGEGCGAVTYKAVAGANENEAIEAVGGNSWQHETDESVDAEGNKLAVPQLREFNVLTDFHAYNYKPLTLLNFPTWYRNPANAIKPVDATTWEVPRMDYSEKAQSCISCGDATGSSGWTDSKWDSLTEEEKAAHSAFMSGCEWPSMQFRILSSNLPHAYGDFPGHIDNVYSCFSAEDIAGEYDGVMQPSRLSATFASTGQPVKLTEYKDFDEGVYSYNSGGDWLESSGLRYDSRAFEESLSACPDSGAAKVPYVKYTVQSYCTVYTGDNNANSKKIYGPVETHVMGRDNITESQMISAIHCDFGYFDWGGRVFQSCMPSSGEYRGFEVPFTEQKDNQNASNGSIKKLLDRGILVYQCPAASCVKKRWNTPGELALGDITGEPVRDPNKPRSNDLREYEEDGAFYGQTPPSYTVDIVWEAEYSREISWTASYSYGGSTAVTVSGIKGDFVSNSCTIASNFSQQYNSYKGSRTYNVTYDSNMHYYTSTEVTSEDTCTAYGVSRHDKMQTWGMSLPVSNYQWIESIHYVGSVDGCSTSLTAPAVSVTTNLAGSEKYTITQPPNCAIPNLTVSWTNDGSSQTHWSANEAHLSAGVITSWTTSSGGSLTLYNSNPDRIPYTWATTVPATNYKANFDPHENPWGNGDGSGGGQYCGRNLDSVSMPDSAGNYTGGDDRKGVITETGDESGATYSRYYSWGGSFETSSSGPSAMMIPWMSFTSTGSAADAGYCRVSASFAITYDSAPTENADTDDI